MDQNGHIINMKEFQDEFLKRFKTNLDKNVREIEKLCIKLKNIGLSVATAIKEADQIKNEVINQQCDMIGLQASFTKQSEGGRNEFIKLNNGCESSEEISLALKSDLKSINQEVEQITTEIQTMNLKGTGAKIDKDFNIQNKTKKRSSRKKRKQSKPLTDITNHQNCDSKMMKLKKLEHGEPSRVLHIVLTHRSRTSDIIHLGAPFGLVINVFVLRSRNEALLEMQDIDSAISVVSHYAKSGQSVLCGCCRYEVYVEFSRHNAIWSENAHLVQEYYSNLKP